ncbi:restriction endonuclease subunit S [Macromonas nakdongensis]|uniref:restriction endonuclease subunit S n=1 Tax=Macromonas nakdongensis TaxID=1843082 RepID=UPI000C32DD81|nr:restriction endonuclease subunit S [Macromonas nakdongensis]
MNNSEKQSLVPQLRFPEFLDAKSWSFQTLAKLARRSTQKNTDGEVIRVLTNSAEFGVIDQRDFFDKDIATQGNLEGYYIVEDGSYVYNPRISALAPVGPISKNRIGLGVMSPLYTVFKFNDARNDFYAHYFKSTHWHQYMRQASSTGARHDRMSISNDAFMSLPLPVSTPDEQQKISDCLSSLDELITAETLRLDALKLYKKSLMQQLFPRVGENMPRLRFINEGDWTVASLPEVVFFQEGPGIMAVDFRSEGVPLVRLAGVGGINVTLDGCNYLDPEKVDQKWAHFRLELDDLIISTSATFGLTSIVTEVAVGAVFYTGLIRFRPSNERLTLSYLKVFLGSPHFEQQAASAAVGGGIKHFGPTHLKQMEIPIPPLAEQRSIADCMGSLDARIAADTRKLETLKLHKQGLMQKIFPVLDGLSV